MQKKTRKRRTKMKQKLTSRKFWAAVVGVITGLAMVFGLDEGVISTVAGAVTALASIIAYISAEGAVDVARLKELEKQIKE